MLELLSAVDFDFVFQLVLCVLAGFAIGIERESRGKAAGISTHSLVIIGAMMFTVMSLHVDPASTSRIAAQIVSGIGFLGAGLIIKQGATIKNLTTAASLWFAGAIGMCFGFGYYFVGITGTIAGVLVPRIPTIKKMRFLRKL